jgi:hypothetical protein
MEKNKINYEERAKVYADALDTFGPGLQLVVALEELSEVAKEICKHMRRKGSTYHLAEEVADATIMLEQVRQIFDINDEVCKIMDEKVLRLRVNVEREKAKESDRRDFLRKVFNGSMITDREAEK